MPYLIQRKTHIINAADQVLGRLASRIANLLIGKKKRNYLPNVDAGDTVVIKNVAKIKFSGRKFEQKEYKHYSGYPGGLKTVKLNKMFTIHPERVLRLAVVRMLPKNRLRKDRINRLKFE